LRNEVYALRLDEELEEDRFKKLLAYVDKEQRERILKFQVYGDALRSLTANILIRYIIVKKLKLNNLDIHFGKNKYGKPYLLNHENFYFNLSHSGVWVVCAISNKAIGIDIEEVKAIEISVAKRFFSPQEVDDLFSYTGKDRLIYFYDLWTLKESYIKAEGKGLAIPLRSFTIRRNPIGKFYLEKEDRRYSFEQYDICNGYKLSVCSIDGTKAKGIKVCNMDKLYWKFLNNVV